MGKGARVTRFSWHGSYDAMPGVWRSERLAAIETLAITAQIRIAEVRAIWSVRSKGWIVARSVMKGASALRVVAHAIVSITRSVIDARTKTLMLCALYQRGRARIGWRRGWPNIGASGTASGQQACCGDEGESETRGSGKIHGVLTCRSAQRSCSACSPVKTLNQEKCCSEKLFSWPVFAAEHCRWEVGQQTPCCRVQRQNG